MLFPSILRLKATEYSSRNSKGGIRFAKSQDVLGELRNMTVSVTPGGKYYVCIMAQVEVGDLEKTNLSVGIDLGLKAVQ